MNGAFFISLSMREIESFEHILLDLGGVIINLDYSKTTEAFKKLGLENFDALYTQFAQSNLFDDYETGQISTQHFVNKLLSSLPPGISPNQIVNAWNAMILDIPSERIETLQKLRGAGKKVYMLSNTNEIHFQKVERIWRASFNSNPAEYYDEVFLSHQIGMRKPHVSTFETVLQRLKLKPEHVLFVDDSIQHIKGAQETGIQSLHLTPNLEFAQLFS